MAERRELTRAEKACAARAKSLWLEKKARDRLTQYQAADALGMTASGFSQYINGNIPLNTDAVLRFARFLEVSPYDIDPDLDSLLEQSAAARDATEAELLNLWRKLPPSSKRIILAQFRAVAED